MSRKRFTYRDILGIVARQITIMRTAPDGIFWARVECPICGQYISELDMPEAELDHDDAVGFGEGRDVPENCAFVHGHCHRAKTAKDKARIAKAKRQAGETGQRARRERNGPAMESRGFDKRWRKRMDGTVEKRDG